MEDLLRYFIEETNKSLSEMKLQLEDLTKFKVEMLVSARTTALIVSMLCGAVTLVASCVVAYFTMRPHG